MMKLSILDQVPIPAGKTAGEALEASEELAKLGEKFGYTRYWIAEHHDMPGLACPNPDVMLGVIGAATSHIRIGAGAVLLPHYKPYRVAETYNLLATLFSGRVDLGLGRAPGGSAEATMALSDNFLEQVRKYPEKIDELLRFLNNEFPEKHMFSKVRPAPVPETRPEPWLLGTSGKSAVLAAEKGLNYVFGHFMSTEDGVRVIQHYKREFTDNFPGKAGEVIIAVSVICAETTEAAEQLALSTLLWQVQQNKSEAGAGIPSVEEARDFSYSREDIKEIARMKQRMVIGGPGEVKQQLLDLQRQYEAEELMIVTNVHDFKARRRSYELIAEACL